MACEYMCICVTHLEMEQNTFVYLSFKEGIMYSLEQSLELSNIEREHSVSFHETIVLNTTE